MNILAAASTLLWKQPMRRRVAVLAAMLILAAACTKEEATRKTEKAAAKVVATVQDVFEASAPMGKPDARDAAQQRERERERFDQQWRALQSFRAAQEAAAAALRAAQQAVAGPQINFVTGKKETFKGLDVNAINGAPVNVPISGDVKGPSVLR